MQLKAFEIQLNLFLTFIWFVYVRKYNGFQAKQLNRNDAISSSRVRDVMEQANDNIE